MQQSALKVYVCVMATKLHFFSSCLGLTFFCLPELHETRWFWALAGIFGDCGRFIFCGTLKSFWCLHIYTRTNRM